MGVAMMSANNPNSAKILLGVMKILHKAARFGAGQCEQSCHLGDGKQAVQLLYSTKIEGTSPFTVLKPMLLFNKHH
jgi:hypothetical protein